MDGAGAFPKPPNPSLRFGRFPKPRGSTLYCLIRGGGGSSGGNGGDVGGGYLGPLREGRIDVSET